MIEIQMLGCPSCGAPLQIEPGSNQVVCLYCGSSFLISQRGSELRPAGKRSLSRAQADGEAPRSTESVDEQLCDATTELRAVQERIRDLRLSGAEALPNATLLWLREREHNLHLTAWRLRAGAKSGAEPAGAQEALPRYATSPAIAHLHMPAALTWPLALVLGELLLGGLLLELGDGSFGHHLYVVSPMIPMLMLLLVPWAIGKSMRSQAKRARRDDERLGDHSWRSGQRGWPW